MAIFHFPLRRLRDKFFPMSLPPHDTFDGRTVLITGGTTGLGLAAAVHFAALGAEVIITSRTKANGEQAKLKIETSAGVKGSGKIHVMELNMERYSSCISFVDELKEATPTAKGLDYIVLNAGGVSPTFNKSPEGWEQTIQVNALSTILIAYLLLPWLKEKGESKMTPPHLIFVTSRAHLDSDISDWANWAENDGILRHLSMKENFPSTVLRPNYDNSKLILTYAVEKLCTQVLKSDGKPYVIVNTVCPGLVNTDIVRDIVRQSWLMRIFVTLWLGSLAMSADYGARIYVAAAVKPENEHGKFLQILYTEEEYQEMAFKNLRSDLGKEVGNLVWTEVVADLTMKVPALVIT